MQVIAGAARTGLRHVNPLSYRASLRSGTVILYGVLKWMIVAVPLALVALLVRR